MRLCSLERKNDRGNSENFRGNFTETRDLRKARFTRATEVVECCQMGWKLLRMQQECNKYINDIYRTFFSKRLLESVLFIIAKENLIISNKNTLACINDTF